MPQESSNVHESTRSLRTEGDLPELRQKAEGLYEEAKEFSQQTGVLLTGWDRVAHKNFPDIESLEALPAEDREQILQLIGRMDAVLRRQSGVRLLEGFVRECDTILKNSTDRVRAEEAISKLETLMMLHVATDINTNTMGGSPEHQHELNNELLEQFAQKKEQRAIGAMMNPYHVTEGEIYYVVRRERGVPTLEEKRFGEVSIDGKDALIDDGGETRTLAEFNRDLAGGNKIMRDGSSYFGGLSYPKELRGIEAGDTIEFISHNPLFPALNHRCEYLGSNEDELREKYGLAYIPFLKDLIRFRVRYDKEEREATWGNSVEIKVHKRGGG